MKKLSEEMVKRIRDAYIDTYQAIGQDFSDIRGGRPARRAEVIEMVTDGGDLDLIHGGDREAIHAFKAAFPDYGQRTRWLAKHVFTCKWYE